MSAWQIGAMTEIHRASLLTDAGEKSAAPPVPSLDTLITWIPGDAMAFYAALVLVLQPDLPDQLKITSFFWLAVGVVASMLLTLLGGWAKTDKLEGNKAVELAFPTVLSGIAFGIWSTVIPGSWWYSIDTLMDNKDVVPIVAALGGAVFSLLAEGLVRRVPRWFPGKPKPKSAAHAYRRP